MARATCWLLLWGYLAAGVQALRPKLENTGVNEDNFNPPIANWQFNPPIPQLEQLAPPPRTGRIAAAQADPDPTYLPLPSQDQWYRSPDGWENTTAGTVLKVRQHAYPTRPFAIQNVGDTFQVQFRSLDSHKNPFWGVTTVFIPVNSRCQPGNATSPTNCTQPILSYQLPYDTSCLDASPSFGLQWGEPYGEIAAALGRGWWVSVPDYEGPLASYGANIVAGYITVDSMRAVMNVTSDIYNIQDSRIAMWGYSNGASATEAAAEFAPAHAPDLKIEGAVFGGLSTNVAAAGPLLTQTQVAGLLVQGLIGVTSQYPEQRKYLVSRLNPSGPYNATEFFWASYMSGWQSLLYYCYVDIFSYFIGGQADLDHPDIVAMFTREGTLGGFGLPNTKIFVYHAVEDNMTPINDTDILVKYYCDQGANVLFHRNLWGGHNDELRNGRQRALDFVGDVLDGTNVLNAPVKGCETVNLTYLQPANLAFH